MADNKNFDGGLDEATWKSYNGSLPAMGTFLPNSIYNSSFKFPTAALSGYTFTGCDWGSIPVIPEEKPKKTTFTGCMDEYIKNTNGKFL